MPSEDGTKNAANKERVEEASVSTLHLLSFSYIGSSHTELGKPNQDYSHFEKEADTLFVAVGDGLGSCAFSDQGSQLVTRQITQKMRDSIVSERSERTSQPKEHVILRIGSLKISREHSNRESVIHLLDKLDEDMFKTAFVKSIYEIRSELELLSTTTKLRLQPKAIQQISPADFSKNDLHQIPVMHNKGDFASTCLFAMTDGKTIFSSHIGDGGIYLVCQNRSELLVEPTKGDSLNETIPLTHDEWNDYLRIRVLDVPHDALFLCLMTDGFAENISKPDPNPFFQRIVNEASKRTKSDFIAWLGELNDYYESRGFSDDDKTASFIFFQNIFEERSE
ncbi:MAG TPA: protein phosphatase 2C domain-containing protein [Pyrinomonadaceae bacterium]|nr:protein phosphatase 2C domain-containing protein [Pyrinomonadaceae bacterium]